MNNKKFMSALLISCSIIMTDYSKAQEDSSSGSTVVAYGRDYFENLTTVTLLDMLQAVPGVPDILNKNRQQRRGGPGASNRGERGFGAGGDQILIDGKRLAGKSNNIDDTLGRISAEQVERIELIRGAAAGLDVQSQGLVVNVIMREGQSTSTTFVQINGEYSGGHYFTPEFLISHSGAKGNFEYILSYEHQNNDFFFDAVETFFDADDNEFAVRTVNGDFDRFGNNFNTNLGYQFDDGSRLRLNGLYEPNGVNGEETRDKSSDALRPIFWDSDRDVNRWEIGGDYERNMGFLGNLKTLFVVNETKTDVTVNRFRGSGDERFEYTRDITDEDRSEKILRGSLSKSIFGDQTLEIGGEGAFNTYDKSYDNFDRDDADSELIIDNTDDVRIKENRFEVFANHSYNISSNMQLQSSLITEFSKIVADTYQDTTIIDTRNTSFTYLKPRVNFRYDITNQDQLRLLVEKKVSQLDFNNFVTRFDQQAQIFRFGNTQIRPEQTWDFSATFEHRLPNDTGSFEIEAFYRKYTDHISTVDFTQYYDFNLNPIDGSDAFFALNPDQALRDFVDDNGESYSAKQGNIPTAKAYGAKIRTNLRLGFIGVPSATLSVNYTFERRRAIDQFTLQERNFDRHSNHQVDVNFRHDVTQYQLAYGLEFTARSDFQRYFIDFFWPNQPAANIKIFAEKTLFRDYKIRFEGEGLNGDRGASNYSIYNDHIRFNDLRERQLRKNTRPIELRISIQGTF